jgi:hypothetical protein
MREMTEEEEALAAELFKMGDRPPPHVGEGSTHLTVRIDNTTPGVVYYGPHERTMKIRMPQTVVLDYSLVDGKQTLLIQTKEGRKWIGTAKSGTDVVILRRFVDGKE